MQLSGALQVGDAIEIETFLPETRRQRWNGHLTETDGPPPAKGIAALRSAEDTELVDRARNGDDAAFRVLVERYERHVAATVTAMLGSGPEADDIGQETFLRFYRALGQYRGDAGVGTYLARIAINLSINASKRRQRFYRRFLRLEEGQEERIGGGEEADAAGNRERVQAEVQRAIRGLTPKLRAVVVLRVIDEYSVKETAEILGVPVGTVLSRMARANEKLKEMLQPLVTDHE